MDEDSYTLRRVELQITPNITINHEVNPSSKQEENMSEDYPDLITPQLLEDNHFDDTQIEGLKAYLFDLDAKGIPIDVADTDHYLEKAKGYGVPIEGLREIGLIPSESRKPLVHSASLNGVEFFELTEGPTDELVSESTCFSGADILSIMAVTTSRSKTSLSLQVKSEAREGELGGILKLNHVPIENPYEYFADEYGFNIDWR